MFNKAALTVLTQVIKDKTSTEELTNNLDDTESTSTSTSTKTRSTNKSKSSNRFASFVRMTQVRQHLNRRKQKPTIKVEPLKLPPRPRFCSLLSPEAQYAMLKGYEDVIIDELQTKYEAPILLRVETPNDTAILIANENVESDENVMVAATQMNMPSTITSPAILSHPSTLISTQLLAPSEPAVMKLPPISRSASYDKRSCYSEYDRQLRLSCHVNTAMGILDDIKKKDQPTIGNVSNKYNSWSRTWSKEFQFRFDK